MKTYTHEIHQLFQENQTMNNATEVSDKNLGYGFLAGMVLLGFLVL